MSVRSHIGDGFRMISALVIVAFITPVAAAGVLLATNLFLPLPAALPEPEQLETIQFSEVYDANGELIHVYRQFDQSIPVGQDDIPELLKSAVIAAEDRRFYDHGGFDIRGTVRALVTDVQEGELAQGGSTITQQLARNAYGVGSERTVNRKIREAILASQLDRSLSKEQILFEYLSIVYFGEGAYGIGAAAQVYFGKAVNDLSLSEAALLAGIIPAPSNFNPRADPGTAEIRRVSVLDTMLEEEMITQAERDAAAAQVTWIDTQGEPPGPATIVRTPQLTDTKYPWFIQYLTEYLIDEFGDDELLYRGGLRIFTTLDPNVQFHADIAALEALDGVDPVTTVNPDTGAEQQHQLQVSITAIEPPTGYVRAMVGGRDFSLTEANIATGTGSSGRQPGSSFKPIVLAEAFEQGITPDAVYSGGPLTIGDYSPENYGGSRYGDMTLRSATEQSVNTVFVRLMEEVDPYEVVDLANKLGVVDRQIDPRQDGSGLAISLGAWETTTMGMASGYGTFANRGVRVAPTPVVRVFDPEGELLIDRSVPDGEEVVKQATADNVTDVLRGVLVSGTAGGRGINRPAAGKTGTAQDNKDGWFVGYTPTLSTAVFLGYDPPPPANANRGQFRIKGTTLTGGYVARTWQSFMLGALDGVPVTDFFEPAPIVEPASEELQRERRGFGPGVPSKVASTGNGGPFVVDLAPPVAPQPTTTTTSTTTTTVPSSTTADPDTTTTTCDGIFC